MAQLAPTSPPPPSEPTPTARSWPTATQDPIDRATLSRSVPPTPGRDERRGGWGPFRGPPAAMSRSAPSTPGRDERRGLGAISGPTWRDIEERPGYARARRA